jgi:hypothetical protein
MVISLVIDYGELAKVALKKGGWEKEWVGRLRVMRVAGFCDVCVWGVYFCCSGGCLCQGLEGAEICAVGRVG